MIVHEMPNSDYIFIWIMPYKKKPYPVKYPKPLAYIQLPNSNRVTMYYSNGIVHQYMDGVRWYIKSSFLKLKDEIDRIKNLKQSLEAEYERALETGRTTSL